MNRALLFFLLLFPICAAAQPSENIAVFTQDSFTNRPGITYALGNHWRFYQGDNAIMSSKDYDDSKWATANPGLYIPDHPTNNYKPFTGIGWFRYHFTIDSALATHSLCLEMSHFGASEIYLDGKEANSFGVINGKDNSIYHDPNQIPFPLVLSVPGEHVIAVRYANYDAERNYKLFHARGVGFDMEIGESKYMIYADHLKTNVVTFTYMLLFGIFIAISMLHLFLFLYYRAIKSNLFFSIFCFSVGLMFSVFFLSRFCTIPIIQMSSINTLTFIISAICLSLNGFINDLYGRKKWQFRIVLWLSILTPVLFFIQRDTGIFALFSLTILVTTQVIIRTIWAIYKKISGARILGMGILFFTVFVLGCLLFAVFNNGMDFDDSTPEGIKLILLAIAAILSLPVSISRFLAWNFAAVNKDLKNKLHEVQLLSEKTLEQELEKKRMLEHQKETLEQEVAIRTSEVVAQKEKIEKQHYELGIEKKKTDDLLLNILPEEVAGELKEKGYSDARLYNDVTVLFTDFVDFTKAGESMGAQELVNELHACFKAFDEIISKYDIEKIKTIGDAYLAVCGLPLPDANHAAKVVFAALEIRQFMAARKLELKERTFEIRIGIHSGSVVAGIVGVKKFAYDIWGDTVNTAARMEQNSVPGKINTSQATYDLVKERFECTYRGEIEAKNKGVLRMYFIDAKKK